MFALPLFFCSLIVCSNLFLLVCLHICLSIAVLWTVYPYFLFLNFLQIFLLFEKILTILTEILTILHEMPSDVKTTVSSWPPSVCVVLNKKVFGVVITYSSSFYRNIPYLRTMKLKNTLSRKFVLKKLLFI